MPDFTLIIVEPEPDQMLVFSFLPENTRKTMEKSRPGCVQEFHFTLKRPVDFSREMEKGRLMLVQDDVSGGFVNDPTRDMGAKAQAYLASWDVTLLNRQENRRDPADLSVMGFSKLHPNLARAISAEIDVQISPSAVRLLDFFPELKNSGEPLSESGSESSSQAGATSTSP
jgi:hypothetical protein